MGSLVEHAKTELALLRDDEPDEMQDAIERDILAIVSVFEEQRHSGSSASYSINCLEKLLRFEPLKPLTGADDEWDKVGERLYQNRRCSHVFKCPERGVYDMEGIIWREPDGNCYTSFYSRVPVTFPYTPKREYRPSSEDPGRALNC